MGAEAHADTLILASGSSVRARLLRDAGVSFEVQAANIDEAVIKDEMAAKSKNVEAMTLELARRKAGAVSAKNAGALVIGADQILWCDNRRYDKPANLEEAHRHLRAFQGREHRLIGATVVMLDRTEVWSNIDTLCLTMRALYDLEIDDYLHRAGEAALESVGAYQLEGLGAQLFERIDGDYFSILGLPLLPLLGFLRDHAPQTLDGRDD